jgi:hypothetical protein
MERARKARQILMELGDYRNFLKGEQDAERMPPTS